jgi:hypothetical protein
VSNDPRESGPLADEAAALFDAFRQWAARMGAAGEAPMHAAGEAAECRLCPLCQFLRLVRGARPEVYEHLADAAASVAAAMRELIVAHEREWSARPAATERIDIG